MRRSANLQETPEKFYDARHLRGWMDHWSRTKVERVLGLISPALPSPQATVLEFGCGTGTLTMALKQRFPSLDVHGCDISPTGISRARQRCPEVGYHVLSGIDNITTLPKADVIYTHHVLEHVDDVDQVLITLSRQLKPGGRLLHILPCGNKGSLEHWLASRVRDGIALDATGLFYLDDISHVRRLDSAGIEDIHRRHGFVAECRYFANQFWGACEYLASQSHSSLLVWLDPRSANSLWSAVQLCAMLAVFVPLSRVRFLPRRILSNIFKPSSFRKSFVSILLAPFCLFIYPLSMMLDWALISLTGWEWTRRKESPNGSEMYYLFAEGGNAARPELRIAAGRTDT